MNKKYVLFFWFMVFLGVLGCSKFKTMEELKKESMFFLNIGRMEDQVDLFINSSRPTTDKNSIFLKEGTFYIANGTSAKIMAFNSFGNIIFSLYNPHTNPSPIVLKKDVADGVVSNLTAKTFGFQNMGEICIDNSNNIYVETRVLSAEKVFDEHLQVYLNSRIIKFDQKGELAGYIGRDGIGESLFPFIHKIFINSHDELIVICRNMTKWIVYWFSKELKPLYTYELDNSMLPDNANTIVEIDNIIPDIIQPVLYVNLSYLKEGVDPSTQTKQNIEKLPSRIYPVNITKPVFKNYIKVPEPGIIKYYSPNGVTEIPAPSYEFLGISKDVHFFLIRPDEESRYKLVILDKNGRVIKECFLIINDRELFYKQLSITETGLLYGFLCTRTKVEVARWRSDKLFGESK